VYAVQLAFARQRAAQLAGLGCLPPNTQAWAVHAGEFKQVVSGNGPVIAPLLNRAANVAVAKTARVVHGEGISGYLLQKENRRLSQLAAERRCS
jgi:hypothetical protein